MDFEGKRGMRPRNVARVIVEVDVATKGSMVEERSLPHGVSRVEVWADRLGAIAAKVRTPAHAAAYEAAAAIAAEHRKEWEAERTKERAQMIAVGGEQAWENHVKARCNHVPEAYLHMVAGMFPGKDAKRGLPPLRSAHVLTRDESRRVTIEAFLELPEAQRAPFLIDPPATAESVQDRQATYLEMIAKAVAGGQQNRKAG